MSIFDEYTDDEMLSGIDDVLTESVFEDTEDIYYNRVAYENGDINLLFIIGYSGGGKSTMSRSEDKFGRDVVDMDRIVLGTSKSDEYFKEMSAFAYSFMTGPGKKYREEKDKDDEVNLKYASDSYRKQISVDLVDYAKQYANSHKSIRLVMEGVWIYRYIEPQDLDQYAVYIKGTSLKTSTERAIKRDNATMDANKTSKLVKAARSVGKIAYQMKDALLGNLEKYQKYYGPKYKAQLKDKIKASKKVVNALKRNAEDVGDAIKHKTKDTKGVIHKAYDKIVHRESENCEEIEMSDIMTENFLSNTVNKLKGDNTKSQTSGLNAEIEKLKKLKAEGKLDDTTYTQKVGELTQKYSNIVNGVKVESSTEKEILDRDAAVGEVDKEIRATNSDQKKKELEKEKDSKDKEINSEKKEMKESESIKKYTGIIERNNARLSEIMESANMHKNEIQGLTEEIENAEKYLYITRMYETAALVKDIFYNEAAHMEDEIKPIVEKLNNKGFKVKYASPGHSKLRKKEDTEPDGVYYGKLYSDARIMFVNKYKFTAPKYWMHRDVDNCSYLDIIPIKYEKKDGSPDEAFAKWKDNYMDSLRKFAEDLKSNSDGEEDEPKTEAVADLIALGTILGAGLIAAAVNAYKKAKLEKKWKLRAEAMHVYPKKHKDCPDMSKLKRTKHQMSAFDGTKGKAVDDNDDNAPGNFIYTYTIDGKPVVIVTKEGPRFTSAVAKDIPDKYKKHQMYIYSYILLYKHGWITPRIEKWLDEEIAENEKLKKKNGGKIVDDSAHVKIGKDAEVTKESDESDLNDIYTSTSYIDDSIDDLLHANGIL